MYLKYGNYQHAANEASVVISKQRVFSEAGIVRGNDRSFKQAQPPEPYQNLLGPLAPESRAETRRQHHHPTHIRSRSRSSRHVQHTRTMPKAS